MLHMSHSNESQKGHVQFYYVFLLHPHINHVACIGMLVRLAV